MKLSLPNAVSTRFAHTALRAQKNSPKLLFGSGLLLMGATVVTSSRATLKLGDVLDEIKDDRDAVEHAAKKDPEKYSDKDIRKLHAYVSVKGVLSIVKLYLPSVILGTAAVACLTASHNELNRRNAGLSAALAATDRALKNYRARVVEELGEDKDREFMFGAEQRTEITEGPNGPKKRKITVHGEGRSPYARLWGRDTTNEWTPDSPEYNIAKLKSVQELATLRLNSRGHVFLNEVLDDLGLDRIPAGQVVGWLATKYGGTDGYVDFGVLAPGEEVRFIDFMQGHEDHIMLDFNVDGEIWRNI